MCGIAGFQGGFDEELLNEMSHAIAHRGPDDVGTYRDPETGVALAHRRLAIIDLSPAGHQPMWDVDKRAVVVFNGEIYNYRDLRTDLVRSGCKFHSHSDTEVLLNLYLRDGESMLRSLNGIFAFAIWDARERTLFLARDATGVKPLYYAQAERGFLFASEIKAILKCHSLARDLDPLAIVSHLTCLWCPAPNTMLRDVKKVKPGHALRVRRGEVERMWQFYDLPYREAIPGVSISRALSEVRSRVRDAVHRQMVSDVPVGAFLSGGLDSAAVVAFAREFAASRMQCFTIGFSGPGAAEEGMTEDLPYAQKVARHLGVDLHTVHVGPEMLDELLKMIYHLDEPQADPAPLNVLFIAQLARASSIKVLLSGAGGDDIFTGYRRHLALMREREWAWMPGLVRSWAKAAANALPNSSAELRRLSKAFQYADLDGDERLVSYFFWSPPELVTALCKPLLSNAGRPILASEPLLATLRGISGRVHRLNRMLYLEGKHFLADHNLNYTDKMSMAAAVEVRVPLLDPDLIEFAARLPVRYKQHGKSGKWIFKKAMEPYLPKDVIYRPKTGFGAPLRHWLRHSLAPAVDDLLSRPSLEQRGIFDPTAVRDLLQLHRDRKADAAYTIFAMMCVEMWCRIFIDDRSQ